MRASDLIVQCLENEEVRYVFGLPGEEILDIAYGRLTGRAGVGLSTLGPVATGVADANLDRAPLVAITGQAGRDRIHKESHLAHPGPSVVDVPVDHEHAQLTAGPVSSSVRSERGGARPRPSRGLGLSAEARR